MLLNEKYVSARGIEPDAIFAAVDTVAVGVYKEIMSRGLRISQEVATIGYRHILILIFESEERD